MAIKYAKTTEKQKDNKSFPLVAVTYLERYANVAICEQYGVHGSAPVETYALMFTIQGDESNRIIMPLSAQTRPKNLKETEFVCGNFVVGSTVFFDENGNITIQSKNNVNIEEVGGNINIYSDNNINIKSTSDINIEAVGNDINIIGDIHVTGAIDATGDIVSDTISLQDHLHSGVQTGGSNTGPPVP